jgi:hypothetical protein
MCREKQGLVVIGTPPPSYQAAQGIGAHLVDVIL